MKIYTWGELKLKLQKELDLEDEDFISPVELMGYAQSAIDETEQIFRKFNSVYFETNAFLPLVIGESIIDMPADIYGNKILLIQYENGERKYTIDQVRDLKEIPYLTNEYQTDFYKYRIVNKTGVGPKITLYPPSNETSASNAIIYYERNAIELVDDDSLIDMPEASEFLLQHIKESCRNKEMGTMYSAPPSAALKHRRNLLIESLQEMIPDGDNKIEPDMSFYEDADYYNLGEI